jgi:hypothetical protein
MDLGPGESAGLPQILIQEMLQGEPEYGAPRLQKYLLQNMFRASKKNAPVVYNTWFDDFEFLNAERLRRQLQTAKKLGCEVFTVDAGWYGAGEGNWFAQAGDWREKRDAAFKGRNVLLEKLEQSDGVIFSTPSYAFRVSGRIKNFLDRITYKFHRPRFFGRTFTAIITQGVPMGKKVTETYPY